MSKNKPYYRNRNKNKNEDFTQKQAAVLASGAKSEDLLRPIEDLQLSEATYNALKAGRVSKIADLACRTFRQMYKIQNIGKKNCIEISKAMAKFGASFAPDAEDNAPRNNNAERNAKDNNGQGGNQKNWQNQNQRAGQKGERREERNKCKKNENDNLNDYLSRQYAGMSLAEILMGRRERPAVEKIERPPLTEKSLVKFCRKGKWGYKDWKDNVIVPPSYEEAFGFFEERACVEKDGKLGYIDRENNLVIDYKYDCATSFAEGLASVTVGEKTGYIDQDGNQVVDFIYDIATPFSDGKAIVKLDGRWGVLSREDLSVFWR